jgi:hypothetical protein
MILDLTMLTFLFLFALVVVAVVLMSVYRRGFDDGERFGAARAGADHWRNFARAQAGVEAHGPPGADDRGVEWELPDPKI